ncbi:hypothetical protein FRB90_005275 [Tulasnella sp. 427]|nr:hypothetical protein FRB90_005275 [Tulasnella sp. 427]
MEGITRPIQKSPILLLPSDLTYDIFHISYDEHCSRDAFQTFYGEHRARDAGRAFRGTLSLVCIQWRELVLSMPVLWSNIRLRKNVQLEDVRQWVRTQLERASTSPLDILITDDAVPPPSPINMMRLNQLIFSVVQQWRSIRFSESVPHSALRVFFKELGTTSAPQLEKLVLSPTTSFGPSVEDNLKWPSQALSASVLPTMRSLSLSRCEVERDSTVFNNLVELKIHDARGLNIPPSEIAAFIRGILAQAPHLRRLFLQSMSTDSLFSDPSRPRPPPIQEILLHHNIRVLDTRVCNGVVVDALLHSVAMPSLEDFMPSSNYTILPHSFHALANINTLPNLRRVGFEGYITHPGLTPEECADLRVALQRMEKLETVVFHHLDLNSSGTWLKRLLEWESVLKEMTWISPLQQMGKKGAGILKTFYGRMFIA